MKNVKISFFLALLFSILGVLSIPGIIIGATSNKILMIFSIVLAVFCFYGVPMFWISYANKKRLNSLTLAIKNDGILDIESLASNFNTTKEVMVNEVKNLLQKRYITGYVLIEDDHLQKIDKKETLQTIKCPNCGAQIIKTDSGKYNCNYCHTSFEIK